MAMCLILAMLASLLSVVPRCAASQKPVQLAGVLAEDLALDRRAHPAQILGDPLLRVGPDAVGMRIIRAPHDVVLADERDHDPDGRLMLIRRIALAAPELARLHRQ